MKIDDAITRAKARIRHYENMKDLFSDMNGQRDYYEKQVDLFRTLLDEIERLRKETQEVKK